AAVRAAVLNDAHAAVLVADHDDLPFAHERALEIAGVRNLHLEADVAPMRSVEGALELARVKLRIGVGAKRNFGERRAPPDRLRSRRRVHDAPRARSLKRWIFPVAVFGSSGTNSTHRGYL